MRPTPSDPTALAQLMPAHATSSATPALPATPLRFDVPAPQNFRRNDAGEWPLTAVETAHVLQIAREHGLTPAQETQELRRARKDKYHLAFQAHYRWLICQEPQPRKYTFEEIMKWFLAEAARYLGTAFVIDDTNRRIVRLLCLYFANDPRFETEGGGSLRKGLLLRGGVGCGKTTLLRIFARNPRLPFRMKPCRELVGDCLRSGPSGQPAGGLESLAAFAKLHKLTKGKAALFNYCPHLGLALDDLGTEDCQAKHFGQVLNPVEYLLMARYDAVQNDAMPYTATHGTTNVPVNDYSDTDGQLYSGLRTMYGSRCTSRFKEMFNFLDFPDGAADRRT